MPDLILKKLKKSGADPQDPNLRSRVGTLSGLMGIGCNLLLFAVKLAVGTLCGSVSITADAMNNLSDASASIVTFLGFRLAGKPADEHHPYGHARLEYLSGLAVAAMILFIGFELAKSSLEKILRPSPVSLTVPAGAVLVMSILVKLWLSRFNRRLGGYIDSRALLATAQDSRNDCLATAAVLAAAVVEGFFDLRVDGFMGLGVAAFILISGWNMARDTVSPLLGEAADGQLRQQILDHIQANPRVLGYHDLMVHDYGPGKRYASLHVEMDHREDPMACHECIDELERECLRSHNVHLVIHYDPVVTDDPELNRLRREVESLLENMDDRLTLHDFRMVQGRKHMNLIFDVPLPQDLRGREHTITRTVEDTLNRETEKQYHVKITFDTVM